MSLVPTNPLFTQTGIHPGEVLKRELEMRGIKQRAFAAEIDVAYSQLNEILNGKRPISSDLALLLEVTLSIPAENWNTLQAGYNLEKARHNQDTLQKVKAIEVWAEVKKSIPFSYFKKQGLVTGERALDEKKIREIYGVDDLSQIPHLPDLFHNSQFRKSEKFKQDLISLMGWLKMVEYMSDTAPVKEFQFSSEEDLIRKLKACFLGLDLIENAKEILASFGIKLIILKKPEKVPVDGVIFWKGNHPVIGLTLRYERIDNLLFTLFHELGHLFLHFRNSAFRETIIDSWDDKAWMKQTMEEQANTYACDHLIPPGEWQGFLNKTDDFSDRTIMVFARQMAVPPATVRGRLCKEGIISYKGKTSIDYQIR